MYTYARIAHDSAIPLVRPLYLEYPDLSQAYDHPTEYFFGKEFLVAPILDSTGVTSVYLPTGNWIDYFTGKKYPGDQVITDSCSLKTMPLFVKEGSIIPMQSTMTCSDAKPLDTLTLQVFGPGSGEFNLYEDDGNSLEYNNGSYSWTKIQFTKDVGDSYHLIVKPISGNFVGQVKTRSYIVSIFGLSKPNKISINGHSLYRGELDNGVWEWNEQQSILTIQTPLQNIKSKMEVEILH
jgi:alpha-glucosidase (family GH31 glycosyl hydrolase)